MKQHFSILLLSALAAGTAWAANPIPLWYPGPNTTQQEYQFTGNSQTPVPEVFANPYGTLSANVALGEFASGWQDPAGQYTNPGVNSDGAWDLGMAGAFTVVCQFAESAPAPGETFSLEFQVYSVAYKGISALPSLVTPGLNAPDLAYTQTTVAPDPNFPGATWEGRKWTGTFTGLTSNQASFRILAPENNISVIDTVEIFTRYTLVPEPAVGLLAGLPALGLLLVRRRGQPVRC